MVTDGSGLEETGSQGATYPTASNSPNLDKPFTNWTLVERENIPFRIINTLQADTLESEGN